MKWWQVRWIDLYIKINNKSKLIVINNILTQEGNEQIEVASSLLLLAMIHLYCTPVSQLALAVLTISDRLSYDVTRMGLYPFRLLPNRNR